MHHKIIEIAMIPSSPEGKGILSITQAKLFLLCMFTQNVCAEIAINSRIVNDGMWKMMVKVVMIVEQTDASSWCNAINESPTWQDCIFYTLALLYGIVASVALVQLIQIQLKVPEYSRSMQKVFPFLNFLANGVRCLVFIFFRNVRRSKPEIVQHILLGLPGLAFFTMHMHFILFWPEIYYRAESIDGLKPRFYTINIGVYAIQITLWLILWWKPIGVLLILSKMFLAGVSLFAALGLIIYSRRLFLNLIIVATLLQGSLVELQEVGYAIITCLLCFCVRSIGMCLNAFYINADFDVLDHSILNFIYYLLVEIFPSSLVLFILRKLSPKRGIMLFPDH